MQFKFAVIAATLLPLLSLAAPCVDEVAMDAVEEFPTATEQVFLTPLTLTVPNEFVVEEGLDEDMGISGVSAADRDAYLRAHNNERAKHGAAALTWSTTLEAAAQKWANKCVFKHSGGTLGPYGENLAAGTGSAYSIASAVGSWNAEAPQYNPRNPQPSHWTQVVWKSTKQVGCAVALCDGIFDPK
jgi:uncharacterized protein YkwD